MTRLLPLFFLAATLSAAPIDDATFAAVLAIGDAEGVPRSVTVRLMFEESGDPATGSRGDPLAVGKEKLIKGDEISWPSVGLFQLHTRPENIDHLVKTYWTDRWETEAFDIRNPRHNATVALRYLVYLHERFGTWYLAAAHYNCGPNRFTIPESSLAYARRIINAR